MGKLLANSPSARYCGSVELHDPLTYPQYLAWSDALQAATPHRDSSYGQYCAALLPGVCACVSKWDITDSVTGASLGPLTPANFPASPRKSADALLAWLVNGIASLAAEADEPDPK